MNVKCINCHQTIPETSKICPYCKNDPNVEVIDIKDFGEINEDIYANNADFDIKTYIKEPKNKKKIMIVGSIVATIIVIFVAFLLVLFGPKKDYSYKTFTKILDDVIDYIENNYFSTTAIKSGEYSLELDLSNYKTKFDGAYSVDFKSRIFSIDGKMRDPKEDEGGIVLDSKEFTYDLYGNLNDIYFKSKEFFKDEYILFPIEDNFGLLKTKKYEMTSLIDGINEAINTGLMKVKYENETANINYRGEETDTKKVYFLLNNYNLSKFYEAFYDSLLDNSNFINELGRVMDKKNTAVVEILNNYKTTAEYKYNTENETANKLAVYYKGKKIYRISLEYNEYKFNFDIGDTKYYFYYYKDDNEVLNVNLTSVEKSIQDIVNKTIELTYKYQDKTGIITLKLVDQMKPKLKKVTIDAYKSVRDFEEADLKTIKNNMTYYSESAPELIQKLFDSFDYKCKPSLECMCDSASDKCSCAYNGTMITCKRDDVKK